MADYWIDVDKALLKQHSLVRLIAAASVMYPHKIPQVGYNGLNWIREKDSEKGIEYVYEGLNFIPEKLYSFVAEHGGFSLNPNFIKALDASMFSRNDYTARIHLLTRNDENYVRKIMDSHSDFNAVLNDYLKGANPDQDVSAQITLDDMFANNLFGSQADFDSVKYSGSTVTEKNKLQHLARWGENKDTKPIYLAPQDELDLLVKDGTRGKVELLGISKSYPDVLRWLRTDWGI